MKQEVDRCRMAIEKRWSEGKTVDGMQWGRRCIRYGRTIYELAQQYPPIEIWVIPGITAAMSGAAVLGRSAHPRFLRLSA